MERKLFISDNIKYLRKKAGLSQTAFAARLGKSQPLISHWEHNGREITIGDALLICKLFNVSIEDFLCTDLKGNI